MKKNANQLELPFGNSGQEKIKMIENRQARYSNRGIPEDADLAELAQYFFQAMLEADHKRFLADRKQKESKLNGSGKAH